MAKRFTWGDTVRIAATAPPGLRPGEIGDVCGIRTEPYRAGVLDLDLVDDETELIFLVEFADGSAMEISGKLLEEPHDR